MPATTPSAISRYGDYLEGMYSRSSVTSDGKFPPTPSKTYIDLAVVEHSSEIRDIEDLRKSTLLGDIDMMLVDKDKIEVNDILKPQENGSPVLLVFVEGPPGIGKSTLAWELCRRCIGGGTRGARGATAPPDFKIYAFGPPRFQDQKLTNIG